MTMIDRLGWTLVHSMWQGVAVAAAVAVVLWMLRSRSPRVRYGVSCAGMAILVALPVATFFWIDAGDAAPVVAEVAAEGGGLSERQNPAPRANVMFLGNTVLHQSADADTAAQWSPLTVVVVVWTAGVVLMGVWQAVGVLWLAVLLRWRTFDAGPEMLAALARMRQRLGVRRRVSIRRASWVDVPAVVGVLRPFVLVPIAVMNGLSPQQVESLIAHELAHVRRWDALVNLGVNLVQIVMFYHPAAWYISRKIREEREHCCDDAAANACGDRLAYARALVAMEEARGVQGAFGGLVMAANGAGRRQLLPRIRRVLGYSADERGSRERRGGAARSLAAVMVALVCAAVPLAAVRSSWAQENKTNAGAAGAGTAESNQKKPAEPEASDPTADDLEVEATAYQVQPGDVLEVTLHELAGPGKEMKKNTRVSAKGTISLPLVGEIAVAGLGEAGIEKAIAKTYQDRGLVQHMMVSASVVEARGNTFIVIGGAARPGQYAIGQPNFRVLDAMATAGVEAKGGDLYVLRAAKGEAKARKVRISLEKLLAGDLRQNIVIRRGDTVIVPARHAAADQQPQLAEELAKFKRAHDQLVKERQALNAQLAEALEQVARLQQQDGRERAPAKVYRVLLRTNSPDVTVNGSRSSWNELEQTLKAMPLAERVSVVLELFVPEDMTLKQYAGAKEYAETLVKRYGLWKLQAYAPGEAPAGGR